MSYRDIFDSYWNVFEGYRELSQYLHCQLCTKKEPLWHLMAAVGYEEKWKILRVPCGNSLRQKNLQTLFSAWSYEETENTLGPMEEFCKSDHLQNSITFRNSGWTCGNSMRRSSGRVHLKVKYKKARNVSTNSLRELSKVRQWFSDGRSYR